MNISRIPLIKRLQYLCRQPIDPVEKVSQLVEHAEEAVLQSEEPATFRLIASIALAAGADFESVADWSVELSEATPWLFKEEPTLDAEQQVMLLQALIENAAAIHGVEPPDLTQLYVPKRTFEDAAREQRLEGRLVPKPVRPVRACFHKEPANDLD